MAEASGSNAADAGTRSAAKGDDATRGRPYYEQLRKDLRGTIERKRELDRNLVRHTSYNEPLDLILLMKAQATIENTIAGLENKYLEETNAAGNIIKGFDNYIKASTSTTASSSGPGTATRRKGGVSDQDRIFSRSSVSWVVQVGHTSHLDKCSTDLVRRTHPLYPSISESRI